MKLPEVAVNKILYATDLSEHARLAFAYAIDLANRYRAGLTILHVIAEDPELDDKVVGYVSAEQWEKIKRIHFDEARDALIGKQRQGQPIRDVLDQFCQDALEGGCEFRKDDILVDRGDPVAQILATASAKQIDLIVLGSHGYGTLKDAMMGGTARRVLRRADVPVLLVRLPADG